MSDNVPSLSRDETRAVRRDLYHPWNDGESWPDYLWPVVDRLERRGIMARTRNPDGGEYAPNLVDPKYWRRRFPLSAAR